VSPAQVYGIERNPYAHALAQMTVWIGFLQWNREHGFGEPDVPVLKAMDNFQCMDAILTEEGGEPEWPSVDYIVGNPPFLGDKLMRGALGDVYVDRLRKHYAGRIPGQSDLCCYWFEKARDAIAKGAAKRAGLLATQAIRQPANRQVFERIKETGDIFFAESDRPWVLDGANVHISMAGFDDGTEQIRTLDRANVAAINSNLTAFADLTRATKIKTNAGIGLIGATKKAPFDLSELSALEMLHEPNVHSRPNSDVLLPYLNAADVTGRWRWKWVIDFGSSLTESEASLFEAPFRYVQREVFPLRKDHREAIQARFWWRFARPVPALKAKTASLERCLVTPSVAKHRVFAWFPLPISPAHRLVVFARDDDFILGVLQSRYHECWALRLGSRLETRPCYTPTTCFETFPFPTPTPAQEAAIGEAARELVRLRDNWLNPLEWTREEVLTFPAALDGPWARFVRDADARGIGTAHYPRLVPKDETAAKALKVRTLTNLYNARPAWLDNAHKKLDAAVAEAYGWPTALGEEEIISRLLVLNLQREGKTAQLRGEIK
jgi:type II restriction/modification system DNA methylase subunit YeeA